MSWRNHQRAVHRETGPDALHWEFGVDSGGGNGAGGGRGHVHHTGAWGCSVGINGRGAGAEIHLRPLVPGAQFHFGTADGAGGDGFGGPNGVFR